MNTNGSKNKLLFLITSVIYYSDKPLSYSLERSLFTSKEREEQTLATIKSIRKHAKNAHIALIEGGTKKISNKELTSLVDEYIYVGKNPVVKKAVSSTKKGLGECLMLLAGTKNIKLLEQYDYVIKLSGRYTLDNKFNIDKFDLKKDFTAKKYDNPKQISTRLYGFSMHQWNSWIQSLRNIIPSLLLNRSIEELLYKKIKNCNNSYVEILGVQGKVGPNGEKIKE